MSDGTGATTTLPVKISPAGVKMKSIADEVRSALKGRHPLIYLETAEENRVHEALVALSNELFGGAKVPTWTCLTGWDSVNDANLQDPAKAIQAVADMPGGGFRVMKDLSLFMERPEVVRALRDAYYKLVRKGGTHLVIVSATTVIPESLQKEVFQISIPLPSTEELLRHVLKIQAEYPGMILPGSVHSPLALALRGLTLEEAGHVMHRILGSGKTVDKDILEEVFLEKKMLLRKTGFLEFVPNRLEPDDIGGLEVLKEWVMKRHDLFTEAAVEKGLPTPKGVLIMGISGCGKSLSAKAIASIWRVPLFRLDMNLVFSGLYGTPETAFHRALKAIESVAPAVLWIDEIESALGMTSESVTVEQSLTFSSFLTWMQERPPLVFVAATANRIQSLPAEIIRKGRFDEVFFCDLPNDEERKDIIRIHLKLNGIDPDTIEVDRLLYSTEGWSGAEIEQAVIAARIDAHRESVNVTLDHIRNHTVRMVPLSKTMAEQIAAIRDWVYNRATRASREKPRTMLPQR